MAEFRRKEIKGNVYWKLQATGEHYRVNKRIKEQVKCLKCWWVHYVDRPSLLAGNCWCRKCSHMTHGLWKTRFYNIFRCIKQRCGYKRSPSYKDYGWRWIMCERNDFSDFYNDMYESYKDHVEKFWEKETSIDRINNDGNYCKENCRWATNKEQGNNQRRTVWLQRTSEELWLPIGTVNYWYYTKWLTLEQIWEKFKQKSD